MEIFTNNFQGSKLKSFNFRMTGYVQYKPINIMMYTKIEYSRNNRYSLIFIDVIAKYSKFLTVYT